MNWIFAVIMAMSAHAVTPLGGTEIGNGGDVLYCPHVSQDNRVMMLDSYEGATLWQFNLSLGANGNRDRQVEMALGRLARKDPARALHYWKTAQKFMAEARFVENANLTDIPDSYETVLPKDCTLKQLAIQRTPKFPTEPRYIVDAYYWNLMFSTEQAALILHEVIFGEFSKLQQPSEVTRYFNAMIMSLEFRDDWTQEKYWEVLGNVGNARYELLWNEPDSKRWWAHVPEWLPYGTTLQEKQQLCAEKLNGRVPTFGETRDKLHEILDEKVAREGFRSNGKIDRFEMRVYLDNGTQQEGPYSLRYPDYTMDGPTNQDGQLLCITDDPGLPKD